MTFRSSLFAAAAASVLLAGCASSGSTTSGTAAPAAKASTAAQVQRVAPAPALYQLAYSARQKAVFVASAGGPGQDSGPSKVLRLDPQTLAVQAEIVLDRKGFGVALDDAADRLYVGNGSDGSITVISTATNKVAGVVQLMTQKVKGKRPDGVETESYPYRLREMVIDSQRRKLYAPGMPLGVGDSVLFVVDTASLKLEKTIPHLGIGATGAVLDAARNRLFVGNAERQVVVIDTARQQIVSRWATEAEQPVNLAYDARRNRVLMVDQGYEKLRAGMEKFIPGYKSRHPGNRVLVHDADSGALVAQMPTGQQPLSLLLDPARERLYVGNRESGTVSVFDSGSYKLLQNIALPTHPNTLALDAASGAVFVSVKNGAQDAKGSNESVARIRF